MRVGIFGSAFDPPHNEHINICKRAVEQFNLDRLVLLPSYKAPHKITTTSVKNRLDMAKLVAQNNNFEVCDIEISSKDKNYTYNTLPKLKKIYGDEIYFIIGGDSILNFDKWYKPLEILKMVTLCVCSRGKNVEAVKEKCSFYTSNYNAKILLIDYLPEDISSTKIRTELFLQEQSQDIPDYINNYITENKVFNRYKPLINKLKNNLSEATFAHSLRTVKYAMQLNEKLGLDANEVFVASLLHDCAKNLLSNKPKEYNAEVAVNNPDLPSNKPKEFNAEVAVNNHDLLSNKPEEYNAEVAVNNHDLLSNAQNDLRNNGKTTLRNDSNNTKSNNKSNTESNNKNIQNNSIIMQDIALNIPQDSVGTPVAHAFAGSIIAKNEYAIKDDNILQAIYYHTTGKANMTQLQKLIYCADTLELGRNYEGVERLRQVIEQDFEKGFRLTLMHGYDYLVEKNSDIYPLTIQAVNFYKE
ncbi:MAG: nicotinate (nicotinamide) nucleotide adenylyltransferase [Clostridia bacterium]